MDCAHDVRILRFVKEIPTDHHSGIQWVRTVLKAATGTGIFRIDIPYPSRYRLMISADFVKIIQDPFFLQKVNASLMAEPIWLVVNDRVEGALSSMAGQTLVLLESTDRTRNVPMDPPRIRGSLWGRGLRNPMFDLKFIFWAHVQNLKPTFFFKYTNLFLVNELRGTAKRRMVSRTCNCDQI